MSPDNFPTVLTIGSHSSLVKRLKASATVNCACISAFCFSYYLNSGNWKKAKDIWGGGVVNKHISWLNSEPEEGQSNYSSTAEKGKTIFFLYQLV